MARPKKEVQSLTTEIGQPTTQLVISNLVQDAKQRDLMMPARLCTIDTMDMDDSIFTPSMITSLKVVKSVFNGKAVGETALGKEYADRVNYNLRNLDYGSFYQAVLDIDTCHKYGYSLIQTPIVYRPNYGWCLSKLSPRDQKSVYAWLWDEHYTEVIGFAQNHNWVNFSRSSEYKEKESYINFVSKVEKEFTILKKNQYLHFTSYSTTRNPQGNSRYLKAYTAWGEKKAFEKLELIGAGKDLGGLFKVIAPTIFLRNAQDSVAYPQEAKAFKQMQENVAKLQDGRSSTIYLPSDRDGNGQLLYDIEIKGIEGSGKQYSTKDIIEQKRKAMYNTWGAGHMLLGQDGVGSNALFNGADLTHSAVCQSHVDQIVDVINTQLIPRILAVNNIYPSWQDIPVFKPRDVIGLSWDEMGKFLQRTQSVQMLTPAIYKKMAEIADLPAEGIEELDYTQKGQSRSGESFGSSGSGRKNQANSTLNVENKSVNNFQVLEDNDIDITLYDSSTNETHTIVKVK